MNIIDLLAEDGFKPFQKTSEEWASACPSCPDHGADRFIIKPLEGVFGRAFCRRCPAACNAYTYLIKYRGLDHAHASGVLGVSETEMNRILAQHHDYQRGRAAGHRPSARDDAPPEVWRDKARGAVAACEKALWAETPEAARMRDWLRRERGLCDAIIKEFHLGLVRKTLFRDRESWGLGGGMGPDK
jgi:hypothetical protein